MNVPRFELLTFDLDTQLGAACLLNVPWLAALQYVGSHLEVKLPSEFV